MKVDGKTIQEDMLRREDGRMIVRGKRVGTIAVWATATSRSKAIPQHSLGKAASVGSLKYTTKNPQLVEEHTMQVLHV